MFRVLNLIQKSNYCTKNALTNSKWDILTAVCLERKPVIVPEMNALEKRYSDYLEEIDGEKSYKSDHELRIEFDIEQKKLLESNKLDLDAPIQITAQDFEDKCEEELKSFKFASRLTNDEQNQKSLNRKLDKFLIYFAEQQIGSKTYFLLPQAKNVVGETLRDTAERILREFCGSDLKWKIYGNAPVGFYKYKYPTAVRKTSDLVGAKIFFYFARFLNGNVTNKSNYLWLDVDEMEQILPASYYKSISNFLITDNRNFDQDL